jgi:D-inositol-3-phosphate glycosyltransferase
VPRPAIVRRLRRTLTQLAPHLGLGAIGQFERVRWVTRPDGSCALNAVGWLDPSRQRAQLLGLQLVVDGRLLAEVPLVDLGPAWCAAVTTRTSWELEVDTEIAPRWATLEVFASTDHGQQSLGIDVVPVFDPLGAHVTSPVLTNASLDIPVHGSVVPSDACRVAGWAILDGAAADYIEVFIDDGPPTRARRGLARLDVGSEDVCYTCGFELVVPLTYTAPGEPVVITVRAVGADGATWHFDPVTISVAPTSMPSLPTARLTIPPSAVPSVRSAESRAVTRLAIFTHSLRLGGGQLYLQELLLRLAATRRMQLLVVSPEDGALRSELEAAGIDVHITRGYSVAADHYLGQLEEWRGLLHLWQADLVVANTLGVFPAVEAAIEANLPVVWAIHESFALPVFDHLNWGEHGLNPAIRRRRHASLRDADAVVFEAESTLDLYRSAVPGMTARLIRYGVPSRAIDEYVANTDRDELRDAAGFDPEDVVLLCMGVFEPRKGILPLIAAFGEVSRHFKNARLVLIGGHPSPYGRDVEAMVDALQLRHVVQTLEIGPDIYPWYRLADFMVSASDVESLPRSMLEAMTFGLPVVTSDTFGTSELVEEGVSGLLCEPNTHSALVSALFRALRTDADHRAEMGRQATKRVAALGGMSYDEDYVSLINQLLKAADEGTKHG